MKDEKAFENEQQTVEKSRDKKMSPVKLLAIVLSVCAGIGISGAIAFNQYQKSEAAKAAEAQTVTTMADLSGDSTESGNGDISVGDTEVTVDVEVKELDNGEIAVEDDVAKVLNEQGKDEDQSEAQTTKTEAEIKELQGSEQPDFVIEPYDDTTMYCSSSTGVNVRSLPTQNSDKLGFLQQNDKVVMNGLVTSYQGQECLWYQIKFGDADDSVAFVNASYLGERPVETTASTSSSTSSSASSQQSQATAPAPSAAQQEAAAAAAAAASAQAEQQAIASAAANGIVIDMTETFTPDPSDGYVDFN